MKFYLVKWFAYRIVTEEYDVEYGFSPPNHLLGNMKCECILAHRMMMALVDSCWLQ